MRDFVLVTHTLWQEAPRIRHQLARLLAGAGHRVIFIERARHLLGAGQPDPIEVEPGVIVHNGAHKLVIGEPDNTTTPRLQAVIEMLKRGNMDAQISNDLRKDIWQKLSLNASGNTVTAITLNDLAQVGADEGLVTVSVNVMKETLAVAAAQGWDLRAETDCDAAARRGRPGQRTSMMQDALAGRAMECEALMGQTQAFARELGIATPTIDVMLPLLRGLDRSFRTK